MTSTKVTILNVDIDNVERTTLLNERLSGLVVTPNVDHLMKLQKDKEFYQIYENADWVICDSRILKAASSFLGKQIKEVITGSDLFPAYCQIVAAKRENNKRVFILGGTTQEMANQARDNLHEGSDYQYIVGCYSPPFGFEKDATQIKKIIEEISRSNANVLAVGLGAPKQEKLIKQLRDRLPSVELFFAIGATVDFVSGELSRAPRLMQHAGLEWFYRMLIDPRRLVKRYLVDDLPFFWLILKQKTGRYRNPFGG